ncbi:hypothetical protein WDW37_03565 [Bdellovibrionota bacterium FG-1]
MPSYTRKVQVPGKSSQELYDKVSKDIGRLMEKTSIGKFDITHDSSAKSVHLKSSMFTATLVCGEGHLELNGKLSLLAAPFRSKIDEAIDKWIAKAFQLQV